MSRAGAALMEDGTGRVTRVNGPLVEIQGLARVAVMDMLVLGPDRLTAEVIAVQPARVVAQVYDHTGGLGIGTEAVSRHQPVSVWLGPWLLGGMFDGLLRPLQGAGAWLRPGGGGIGTGGPGPAGEPGARTWIFRPVARPGQPLDPGDVLGVVPTASGMAHRILVPEGTGGPVDWLADEGPVAGDAVVARVGGVPVSLGQWWPVRRPRPVSRRLALTEPLVTGQRVLDLLFPAAKGGTAAVPGGFGTGKTMLLQQVLKWSRADVVVFIGCGERGNELADALTDLQDLADPRTGRPLIERTVVIANTSNMPVMAREASIYTGMTVAEYYRDMGYDVVLLADSTSRWAEAQREFASRNGELPAEEGYPAGLASALASFYERAGRFLTLGGVEGSITAIGAVSPPGGDMTEPVSAHTERFVRCLWSLDRDLAYSRHYPAVTWRRSFSRDAPRVDAWRAGEGQGSWTADRRRAMTTLTEADRLEPMVEVVGLAGLPDRDRVALLGARVLREGVLQQSALSANDATCGPAKQSALLRGAMAILDRCQQLLGEGVSAARLEQADLSGFVRLRDEAGPDDGAAVERGVRECLDRLSSPTNGAGP